MPPLRFLCAFPVTKIHPAPFGVGQTTHRAINRPDGAHHGCAQTQRRVAYLGEEGASGRRDDRFPLKIHESGTVFFCATQNISVVFSYGECMSVIIYIHGVYLFLQVYNMIVLFV